MNSKEKAVEVLNKIYNNHKENGLEAVYLWGSVVTGGFNEENSDIDSIGIVSSDATVTESDFEEDLKNSGFKEFHLRLISEDDLKSGEINKENIITTVIFPRVLLFDLPNWELVVGKDLKIEDFTDNPPTIKEVINHKLDKVFRDKWEDFNNVQPELFQYHLKGLLRFIHYRQIDRGSDSNFSMQKIEENADEFEKEIIEIFKESKSNNYDKELSSKYSEKIDSFIVKIIEEYRD